MPGFALSFDAPRQPVVLGLSGGRDSVALLLLLLEHGVTVSACHVHHGIRGAAADADAQFCRELCSVHRVPFEVYRVDVPVLAAQRGESLEATARRERRRILAAHARHVGYSAVALAHHAEDQAETVLFNLARGSAGLRGMLPKRVDEGITWLRPMLHIRREEISAFLRSRGQSWCEDTTNADPTAAARNAIRLRVLPALQAALGRDIVPSLLRGARLQGEVQDALDAALGALPLFDPQGRLYLPILADKPAAFCKAAVHFFLKRGGVPDISETCVCAVCEILSPQTPTHTCNLPGGFRAHRAHKRLSLRRPGAKPDQNKLNT